MPFDFTNVLGEANPFAKFPYLNDVPIGKKVIIKSGGEDIFSPSITGNALTRLKSARPTLILDDSVSLNISSNYDPLIPVDSNSLLNLISGSLSFGEGGTRVGSGQFVQQGIQIWKSTEPVSFTLNCILMAQSSGKEEVFIPWKRLTSLTLPDQRDKNNGDTGWGLIPPGPNISDVIGAENTEKFNSVTGSLINIEDSKGVLEILIGNFLHFKSVVIQKVTPTFSSMMDEEGYPVQCQLSLDFVTTDIATSNMINNLDDGESSGNVSAVQE